MKIYDYILCSGSGNRFLLFDTLRSDLSGLNIAAFAAEELHRFGVDGLLLLTRDGRGRFGMRMFNTDGSEAEMCGNGIRCVARLARERYPEATGGSIPDGSRSWANGPTGCAGYSPGESTSASSADWTRDASSRRPTSAALASPPPAARR